MKPTAAIPPAEQLGDILEAMNPEQPPYGDLEMSDKDLRFVLDVARQAVRLGRLDLTGPQAAWLSDIHQRIRAQLCGRTI